MSRLRSFADSWWAVAVIIVLTGVILVQRLQMGHMRPAEAVQLQVGEHLPEVDVTDLEKGPLHLDWQSDGRPTVLYVLAPSCAWCKKNLKMIQALTEVAGSKYRFIGISLEQRDLPAYVAESFYRFPVYFAGVPALTELKLSITPETVVISPQGDVVQVWRGAYSSEIVSDIQKTLGIQFADGVGLNEAGSTSY